MMTFKELKKLVKLPLYKEQRVPTVKALEESGVSVVAEKILENHGSISVYQNGYVIYRAHKRVTVFSLRNCVHYKYDALEGAGHHIEEEEFDEYEWHIRLVLEGEDRIFMNYEIIQGKWMPSREDREYREEILEGVDEAVSTLERMISEERVEELLSTLTDLQRKVVHDLMSKMLSTVFFFTCIILITPFVSLYTGGISDIDYYQPLFATLLCLAEYVYCTSLTYNNMIMAAGHIKQTQWISVTEAIINIVLSLILVKWIGIIGVALGTLIAFAFNTVANIVYMKKYIFDMSLGWIIKVYLANLVAGVLAMCLFGNIVNAHITGFISFFIWAAVVFAGVCLIDVVLNYFFFKNETKTVLYKIGKKFAR